MPMRTKPLGASQPMAGARYFLPSTIIVHGASGKAYVFDKLHDGSSDLRRQGSREDHGLLCLGGLVEDFLHVLTHVRLLQHLVDLINDEDLHRPNIHGLPLNENLQTSGARYNDMRRIVLEHLLLRGKRHTSIHRMNSDALQICLKALEFLCHLISQLARVNNANALEAILSGDALQGHNHEHRRFAHTRLGLGNDIVARQALRDGFLLNCSRQQEESLDCPFSFQTRIFFRVIQKA